jgi:outer membrane protein OmpA-like peptidoglycan-associated protein
VLDRDATTPRKNPDLVMEVAPPTCNVGVARRNERLSERRTAPGRTDLISQGANPTQLEARGYCMTGPVAYNATEDGRAANRRVELRSISAP